MVVPDHNVGGFNFYEIFLGTFSIFWGSFSTFWGVEKIGVHFEFIWRDTFILFGGFYFWGLELAFWGVFLGLYCLNNK